MFARKLAMVTGVPAGALLAAWTFAPTWVFAAGIALFGTVTGAWLLGVRHVPHDGVGIVEKLWALGGDAASGRVLAASGQVGFQAGLVRGGFHVGLFPWQYRLHVVPLVRIGEGRIGYVHARDGRTPPAGQTLGRVVDGGFLDAAAFLAGGGQRGRQRGILREGLHAVNLVLFAVLMEDRVYAGPIDEGEKGRLERQRRELLALDAFPPVVVGRGGPALDVGEARPDEDPDVDATGIVTVHDGAAVETGAVIDLRLRARCRRRGHADFQDPEAFFALGGRRGRQAHVLRDGTYYINRWFATVEIRLVDRRENVDEGVEPGTSAPGVANLLELLPGRIVRRRATLRRVRPEVRPRWIPELLRNESESRSRPRGRPWGTGNNPTLFTPRPAVRRASTSSRAVLAHSAPHRTHEYGSGAQGSVRPDPTHSRGSRDGRTVNKAGDVPGQARRGVIPIDGRSHRRTR